MNQTAINLLRLAAVSHDEKKQFAAFCALAKNLSFPSPKRLPNPQRAATKRLQNFVKGIKPQDLQAAIGKFGSTSVFNRINSQSILEVAAQNFRAMALNKAGKA